MKKKEKTEGGRWLGEEEKLPLLAQFLWRYLEDHTAIFLAGSLGGSKTERVGFDGHSGPYRKVTFERTIARLFGHICGYE